MRLSDAIAVGRVLVKGFVSRTYFGDGCTACAIGVAQLALGKKIHDDDFVFSQWEWLGKIIKWSCPSPGCWHENCKNYGIAAVGHVMRHVAPDDLCHEHNMTFDQLIDWVRSVEPAEINIEISDVATEAEVSPLIKQVF